MVNLNKILPCLGHLSLRRFVLMARMIESFDIHDFEYAKAMLFVVRHKNMATFISLEICEMATHTALLIFHLYFTFAKQYDLHTFVGFAITHPLCVLICVRRFVFILKLAHCIIIIHTFCIYTLQHRI